MDIYTEIILDHYKNPQNWGELENADLSAEEFNPLCGDKVRIDISLDQNNRVKELAVCGEGCAISQASLSMLSEKLKGLSLDEISSISNDDIYEMLAIPISPARVKCALLSLVAAKKAALLSKLK